MKTALALAILVANTTAAFGNTVRIDFSFEEFRYYFAPAVPAPDTEIAGSFTFDAPVAGFSGNLPLNSFSLVIDGNEFENTGTTLSTNGFGLSGFNSFSLENLETGNYRPGIPGFLIQLSSSSSATYTTKASSHLDVYFSGNGSWHISAVPEPVSAPLLASGVISLLVLSRWLLRRQI